MRAWCTSFHGRGVHVPRYRVPGSVRQSQQVSIVPQPDIHHVRAFHVAWVVPSKRTRKHTGCMRTPVCHIMHDACNGIHASCNACILHTSPRQALTTTQRHDGTGYPDVHRLTSCARACEIATSVSSTGNCHVPWCIVHFALCILCLRGARAAPAEARQHRVQREKHKQLPCACACCTHLLKRDSTASRESRCCRSGLPRSCCWSAWMICSTAHQRAWWML